jgi:hypothetical protein
METALSMKNPPPRSSERIPMELLRESGMMRPRSTHIR